MKRPFALLLPQITSLALSLMLFLLPAPEVLRPYLPLWPLLVVLFWCLHTPERFGLAGAWITGLFVDLGTGAMLGQNALLYTLCAALILWLHLLLRPLPRIQLALFVAGLSGFYLFFDLWMRGGVGESTLAWAFFYPILGNLLAWPLLSLVMEKTLLGQHGANGERV
ncbi:MAG: rod shape-determining protein MreD [Halothiobacillaceae bacterium]|nr:rod shape-determining protein MreD [Halothiobacillaceae bacterium]